MPLYFITGNQDKFREVKMLIPEIEQMDIDLPEIQELDQREIIKSKLQAALAHHKGEFIVDDTGLYLPGLNGLPGPLSKWFTKALGTQGLYDLVVKIGDYTAEARAIIGYARKGDDIHFFEGVVKGKIVAPRGDSGFGWDPIFLPEGKAKTYAEMGSDEKVALSHRSLAVNKLLEFLKT